MPIEKNIITKKENLPSEHVSSHPDYEYHIANVVPRHNGNQCAVAFYDIAPGKSNYPFHYHNYSEEVFYIISGQGIIETNEGNFPISAGSMIFCPAGADGAHKITNTSDTAPLCYIDIDTVPKTDMCIYPKTGKIGVYTHDGFNNVYKLDSGVGYYDGE
jgi:Uncharacterized conserved protein, contains double-stranded beta-helix domain